MMGRGMQGALSQEPQKARDVGKTLRRLSRYFKPFGLILVIVLALQIINALFVAAGPAVIGRGVNILWSLFRDGPEAEGSFGDFSVLMFVLFAIYLGTWASQGAAQYMVARIGQKILFKIRGEIFGKILFLAKSYFDKHETGDIMSRLSNDTQTINRALGMGLARFVGSIFQLLSILITMLVLNWRLALVSLSIVPLMLISTVYFSNRARKAFRKTRKTIGQVSADLEQNISGVRVAQAFSRQKKNISSFERTNEANRQANVSAESITAAFSPTLDVLSTIGIAIVVGYGGYLAINDLVSIGLIVAFLQYVRRFFFPVRAISMIWGFLQSAIAGAERIFELFDDETVIEEAKNAEELKEVDGRIEFSNVSFSYLEGEEVLDKVSFVCEPGQTVAIVGPTGAGKTTIISLLLRFYDVDSGSIEIDGRDIRNFSKESLRESTGIVLQDPFLFSDSLANNIRYGKPGAGEEDIRLAAENAGALDFIERLPEGFDTDISEGASNISIGQKQLVSLARALLADPKILILDEATSNVDTRTELLIQGAIKKLLAGRTSIVIAHRLSTVQDADVLIVIDEGKIVERGTHGELLEKQGVYHKIYMSQFETAEI